MNLAGISIALGLLTLAWVTLPWGLILLAGLVWFATIDLRKKSGSSGV
jgi:hypothetical protein